MQLTPTQLLHRTFGFSTFRPGQQQVIDTLLAGRSSLAIFPTGGGKSLCYQLTALLLDGLTVVISPLIALMKDQVDVLQRAGVAAARLDSSIAYAQVQQIYRDMADGSLKILYIAPERLANERFLQRLKRVSIALLAVDEAHCISEWGHNFRPDYLKIAQLAVDLRVGRVLALTATATPQVAEDICRAFNIAAADQVLTGFNRPNLALSIIPCSAEQRSELLLQRLNSIPSGSTIVYVTLQHTAVEVATLLTKAGLPAHAYHAGLKDDQRSAVQDLFMGSDNQIIVATIAFGMGIDKADIRTIIHYNLPKTIENYMQEIGRAGRDGQPAQCELLACSDDATVLANFTYGDTPTPEALQGMITHLLNQGQQFSVSRYELSANYDIRPLVVATVLTYLELGGTLEATGPFYAGYKFKFLRPSQQICANYPGERGEFLAALFAGAKAGRVWSHVVPDEAALALNQPRDRITAALTYLEEQGDLLLESSGLRYGYRLRQNSTDSQQLIATMVKAFADQEQQNLQRLSGVLAFVAQSGCVVRHLLNYFGEQLEQDCGQCSSCCAETVVAPMPAMAATLSSNQLLTIQEVHAEHHSVLTHPRQLARFLCGISSPAISKARLTKDARFGCLAQFPFAEVLTHIEQLPTCRT
ncbi:MAG: ATP-dependent DNA helicase RecQ [Thermodesulfobacteriota bacterium]|nr:ATP-dependent DNA helicase RecQ [Thermodesulfobacteriota bacterium]